MTHKVLLEALRLTHLAGSFAGFARFLFAVVTYEVFRLDSLCPATVGLMEDLTVL